MLFSKFQKINAKTVSVASGGAISVPHIKEGSTLPLVVIDADARPDLRILLQAHRIVPAGDIMTQWVGDLLSSSHIGLYCKFFRPSECEFVLRFSVAKFGSLVDLILATKYLYLQAQPPSTDHMRTILDVQETRVLVEVNAGGFEQAWEKIWYRELRKNFQKEMPRKEAKSAATKFIDNSRGTYRDLRAKFESGT